MLDLAQYDETDLPPECLLDENHPQNDAYIQSVKAIERRVVAHCQTMPPRHVEIVRLVHQGIAPDEIKNRTGRANIPTLMKKPASRRLLALLQHLSFAVSGPNIAQRKNMLWRIAQREEDPAPRTAIAAISELNKFDLAQNPAEQTRTGTTIIQINQQVLPRGKLDEEEVIDV